MVLDNRRQEGEVAVSLTSSDPIVVRKWLAAKHRKQLALLDKFLLELRLGRIGLAGGRASREDGEIASVSDPSGRSLSTEPSAAAPTADRRLIVLQTVELLKCVMGPTGWKCAAELMYLVRAVGSELYTAGGMRREPAIGNVIRRILAAIREEAVRDAVAVTEPTTSSSSQSIISLSSAQKPEGNRLSLDSILWALPQHVKPSGSSVRTSTSLHYGDHERQESFVVGDSGGAQREFPPIFYKHRPELKQTVMEAVQEILSDLEDTYKNVNEQATSHIQAGDVVLTCGRSKTTELLLKAAANKKRKQGPSFQVIICEGGSGGIDCEGRAMAESLAQVGIETILIPDSAVFAVMSRVSKVILPAHAVLANGGLIANSGCNIVALAAHYHSVPVVCVTGIFKLCPMFPHEGQDTLNDLISPSSVLEFSNLIETQLWDVEFVNPLRDYIKPEHINLYITNVGSFQPSFIYRLLTEYYHSDDWDLFD